MPTMTLYIAPIDRARLDLLTTSGGYRSRSECARMIIAEALQEKLAPVEQRGGFTEREQKMDLAT